MLLGVPDSLGDTVPVSDAVWVCEGELDWLLVCDIDGVDDIEALPLWLAVSVTDAEPLCEALWVTLGVSVVLGL